ncbi:MAG: hypothetical protein R8G01_06850 [Ilumatobacteraceae bacterium]|nr:hypothetical protein [Ilumatobacteraceae bacterium]
MIDIAVSEPVRTPERYEFRCTVSPVRRWRSRLAGAQPGEPEAHEIRFGFVATNFAIRHHPVWDSVYPLLYLTRNGGPLFQREHDRARIRFDYPVSKVVADFYVRRAAQFGIDIDVRARSIDLELSTGGDEAVLAFGGGKDSRLLLGLARELGSEPRLVTAGASPADLPMALVTHSIPRPEGMLADRIMPSLMHVPRHLYFGGGLGEAHRETPWQQYYDMASPRALAEWSAMFRELGATIHMHAPCSVLPYNITQRILCERYPELASGQASVRPGARSDKNLHVALLKREHGIAHDDHCDEELLETLLVRFVAAQEANPSDFGYRNARETISREMRAIIWRHRDEPAFGAVRGRVPPEWDADWIDYVHDYVSPDLDPAYFEIYRQYAAPIDEAPGRRRIVV